MAPASPACTGRCGYWPTARGTGSPYFLTGGVFFPDLISGPLHHGLIVLFSVSPALAAIASLASVLRGGR